MLRGEFSEWELGSEDQTRLLLCGECAEKIKQDLLEFYSGE